MSEINVKIANVRLDRDGDYQFNAIDELGIDYAFAVRNTVNVKKAVVDNNGEMKEMYVRKIDETKSANAQALLTKLFGTTDLPSIIGADAKIYEGTYTSKTVNGEFSRDFYTLVKPNEYPSPEKLEYPNNAHANGKTILNAKLVNYSIVNLPDGKPFGNIMLTFDVGGVTVNKYLTIMKYVGDEIRPSAKDLKVAAKWLSPIGNVSNADLVNARLDSLLNKECSALIDTYNFKGKQGTYMTIINQA